MILKNIIKTFSKYFVVANIFLFAGFFALVVLTFSNLEFFQFWYNFCVVILIIFSLIIIFYTKIKNINVFKIWFKCLIIGLVLLLTANGIWLVKIYFNQKSSDFKGYVYITQVEKTQFGSKIYAFGNNSVWQLILPNKAVNFEPGTNLYIEGILKYYEYSLEKEFGTKEFYQNIAKSNALSGEIQVKNLRVNLNCDAICFAFKNINKFKVNQLKNLQSNICTEFSSDWTVLSPYSNCSDILALSSGLILGGSNGFSSEMKTAFQKTGLTHIVAISGFNISLIIVLIQLMLSFLRISFRWRFPLTFLIITMFVILVGPSASVVRAAFMGLILIGAKVLGRHCSGIRALLLSALLMLLINPYYLYSISFLLSFLATFGLLSFVNLELNSASEFLKAFLGIFWGTVTANLFTLPVLINVFGYISILSFIPNLIILPFVPFLMLGNVLGLLPIIGKFFIFITGLVQAWLLALIQLFAAFLPVIYVQSLKPLEIIWWYFILFTLSKLIKLRLDFSRKSV